MEGTAALKAQNVREKEEAKWEVGPRELDTFLIFNLTFKHPIILHRPHLLHRLLNRSGQKKNALQPCHPEQNKGNQRIFPLNGLIFSLNYESNG